MKTEHFTLKEDGKLYWIKDMPVEPRRDSLICQSAAQGKTVCFCADLAFENGANRDVVDNYDDNCPHRYKSALQSAIESAIKVKNQDGLNFFSFEVGKIYSLDVEVSVEDVRRSNLFEGLGPSVDEEIWYEQLAVVSLKPETETDIPHPHLKAPVVAVFERVKPEKKEETQEPKDVIDFAVWYSGMERQKVVRAYQRYQKEVHNNTQP